MAKWKLARQTYGSEEFTLSEGDKIFIGRGLNNEIILTSLVISRRHCCITVLKDRVTVEDLKSSNGTYVGGKKIDTKTPVAIKDSDLIGIGWSDVVSLDNIKDNEKYIFKLIKEKSLSIRDRISFQNENDVDYLNVDFESETSTNDRKVANKGKQNLKRKHENRSRLRETIVNCCNSSDDESKNNNCIVLLSDSDTDTNSKGKDEVDTKRVKLEVIKEEVPVKEEIKAEPISNIDYDAFSVKEEYSGYDDDPIYIDTDSEDESERWLVRLSQSSPGKPFLSQREVEEPAGRDSQYSFHSDSLLKNQEEEEDDLIKLPFNYTNEVPIIDIDEVDNGARAEQGISSQFFAKQIESQTPAPASIAHSSKTNLKIPIELLPTKTKLLPEKSSSSSSSRRITKKQSPTKISITNSQKEERKKRLKEIAVKEKETTDKADAESTSSTKKNVVAKVTSSNRGAFLTESESESKPSKEKDSQKTKSKKTADSTTESVKDKSNSHKQRDKHSSTSKGSKSKDKKTDQDLDKKIKTEKETKRPEKPKESLQDYRVPLKDVKPLTEKEDSLLGKPVSKVDPLPKPKKRVRFSENPPMVRVFEIEPGNQMKKTNLVKATLLDVPQMPMFSLEKISLMRILRWNPHWLNEQVNFTEPPPILGHNDPLSILHYFKNHTQYVQVVGDLLLMEIWECVTQAFMRKRDQEHYCMSIEQLPPVPSERAFDIFTLSVHFSLPKSQMKNLPRIGELILVTFGPENARNHRFFYVCNVRSLPAPPTNKFAFFSISLQTVYTDKMNALRPGEVIHAKPLAYIKNEMMLFDAMDYMARSPLSEAILRPEPKHFSKDINANLKNIQSQWTEMLNESQVNAVSSVVSAALGDRPSIKMIQGPPGTGKSSVICSTVMTYFYDMAGKRRTDRGKILICATSNAAVDELVIRLLNIRQSLPKNERFRMVRVGRPEAMHARVREISSQSLAERDAQRSRADPAAHNAHPQAEEIGRLEARLNMWRSMALEAKDPGRVAYCQTKTAQVVDRIAQLRGGGPASGPNPEQFAHTERRIIEGADIVVTTLASAANVKMKGLKRRIALCIVDEAGQAIEPETLIPLTLDVGTLALIGDPQQLPGFICSQRAKKYGLGESLFSRLSSSMEHWNTGSPVILLDVQYRMHPQIADYPNRAFYGGQVNNSVAIRNDLPLPPYAVICIASGDKGQDALGANEMEAWGAARLAAAAAAAARARRLTLALVTPYQGHRDLLRKAVRTIQHEDEPPIEVNTVDSFQGQERDVVVVSLARSHGAGFLTEAGRMNVMLTRARHSLIICLNPHALMKNNQWRTLIEDAKRRKVCKYLPNKVCQPVSTSQITDDDILKYL